MRQLRAKFAADRLFSSVEVCGFDPWQRYFLLFYPRWPCGHAKDFVNALEEALPYGTKCYGGFFAHDLLVDETEGRLEMQNIEIVWNEWKSCYEERWVEVLIDFGVVEGSSSVAVCEERFEVFGVSPITWCFCLEILSCHETEWWTALLGRVFEQQRKFSCHAGRVVKFGEVLVEEYRFVNDNGDQESEFAVLIWIFLITVLLFLFVVVIDFIVYLYR